MVYTEREGETEFFTNIKSGECNGVWTKVNIVDEIFHNLFLVFFFFDFFNSTAAVKPFSTLRYQSQHIRYSQVRQHALFS